MGMDDCFSLRAGTQAPRTLFTMSPPSPLLRGRGARSRELLDPPPAPAAAGARRILASEKKLAPAAAGAVEMVPGEERARGGKRERFAGKRLEPSNCVAQQLRSLA